MTVTLRPLLLALLLCAAGSTSAGVTREGDTVRLHGTLDQAGADALGEHLRAGARRLVVTSAGGDAGAALAVAETLRARATHLVVEGYCLASCANYLFLAAPSKELAPGALLGFHGGQQQHAAAGAPLPALDDGSAFIPYARQMRADSRLYRELGVDRDLLRHSGEMAGPERLYFPSAATLARYGVTGIGAYPYPDSQEALDALARNAWGQSMQAVGDFPARGAAN